MEALLKEYFANQIVNVSTRKICKSDSIKVGCSNCKVRNLCLPIGLSPREIDRFDDLVVARIKVKRGETLIRNGEKFTGLYAIRTGFFKTRVISVVGREQVTDFPMAGDIIGMDGIETGRHAGDAIALEDSEVCVMPFAQVEELSREVSALQHHIHKIMSQEIVRQRALMLSIGSLRSEERIAAFLLNLTQRLHARGYSQTELVLRMTREDIGSLLCVNLETVSRTFSRFAADGILVVKHKHLHILDMVALQNVVNPKLSKRGVENPKACPPTAYRTPLVALSSIGAAC